jgi:SNF2 family DNA or RNA helicase
MLETFFLPVEALTRGTTLGWNPQVDSFKWMINNHRRGVSCILGDEMGLGKTAQATAVMEHIRLIRGATHPFLVIAPLTTLGHWKREIESWTDMNVVAYEVRRLLIPTSRRVCVRVSTMLGTFAGLTTCSLAA